VEQTGGDGGEGRRGGAGDRWSGEGLSGWLLLAESNFSRCIPAVSLYYVLIAVLFLGTCLLLLCQFSDAVLN
jgi:hypothetical protein